MFKNIEYKLRTWLREPAEHKPGFIGPVPYLLLVRWLICFGMLSRFLIHRAEYTDFQWKLVIALLLIAFMWAIFSTITTIKHNRDFHKLIITIDVLIISAGYILTKKFESDFYLFYYLPVFTAAEFLSIYSIVIVFLYITLAFITVFLVLPWMTPIESLVSAMFRHFLPREVFFLSIIALISYLHKLVKDDLTRREREIEGLRIVDRSLIESTNIPNIEYVLHLIIDKTLEITKAELGIVFWYERWNNILKLKIARGIGLLNGHQNMLLKLDDGIIGRAAHEKKSYLLYNINDYNFADNYKIIAQGIQSALIVPIFDENGLLGIILIGHHDVGALTENDCRLVETFANQAVIAIHSINLIQRLECQIKPIRSFGKIATRILDATYEIDTTIRIILTGITSGEGLGFSRALFFIMDDKNECIRGKMGIGSLSLDEASSTWTTLREKEYQIRKDGGDLLEYYVNEAEQFSNSVRQGMKDLPISEKVKELCIPFKEICGAICDCLLSGQPVLIKDQPDFFRKYINDITIDGDPGGAFGFVPLIGDGCIIGAIYVDNQFLTPKDEIHYDQLNSLEAFAHLASMSIANQKLRSKLIEEKKLTHWKEAISRCSHIINQRVSLIADWVTAVRWGLEYEAEEVFRDRTSESWKRFNKLKESIDKSKRILIDFQEFSKGLNIKNETVDLIKVLNEVFSEFDSNEALTISKEFSENVVIQGDARKLGESFGQLVRNSCEAMPNNQPCHISVKLSKQISSITQDSIAHIEFADNGPGIPIEDKNNIFEPFFSRKASSGLGLAIIKEIILQHGGTIDEIGKEGDGAKFLILLHIAEPFQT